MGADVILPETGDVMAAAAEGAKVGSATPEGQCLGDVSGLLRLSLTCEGAPVVAMGFAGVAGCGGDGVLGGYCHSDGEDDSTNLHLDLGGCAGCKDRR